MAYPTLRSPTNWPPRPSPRAPKFKLGMEEESHIVVPYDDSFWTEYGNFIEAIERLSYRCRVGNDVKGNMVDLSHLSHHINIMIGEVSGDTSLTESFMDSVYGSMEDDEAALFLDEVTSFHNSAPKPFGFDFIRQMESQNETLWVIDLTPLRQEDSMVYSLIVNE